MMWRVLTHPTRTAFEAARADANLGRAIVNTFWVGLIIGTARGFLHWSLSNHPAAEVVTMGWLTAFALLAALIASQAFVLSIAHTIGGRGDFATQTYLAALTFAPLNAIAMSADVAPSLNYSVVFATSAYNIFLMALALRAAHGHSWRAPGIVVIGLAFIGQIIGWLVISAIPM